ncbi:dihydrofolate reductase [Levilactobacillus senmaizukei DSM 21775 = NBRC 103853]|uniref:Dihydrofolate reductase n=1 Tax=Levilactobacillus senmaizukei DSM 21775 = NBRC 103853 TaxID=1423803 RepID=A0A0R2DFN5_9LACO|nr:dihydrofolate reductase family protein [Levilactobacillus senmaizukei]KRN02115.1 dihydrofolate reductase [Levilactobacillus senmaizukei DSM 21775 = NBRC 103853]
MGKIIFYGATSLDGYLATRNDQIDWLTGLTGLPKNIGAEVLGNMTTAILGRTTYDYLQTTAPDRPLNPFNLEIISYVLTHRPLPSRHNVAFSDADVIDLAQELQIRGIVWIVGGGAILTSLLAADLVDELYLQIAPTLLGDGKRLFGNLASAQQFNLQATHQYGPLAELVFTRH